MKFSRHCPEEVSVNLTPLIDVVFLLLIFFMVSTTFTKETQLEIDLPGANAGAQEKPVAHIEIQISAEGVYHLNGEPIADSSDMGLRAALEAVEEPAGDTPLVIAADAATPHQAVVTAMDVAGQLGYTRLSITTQELGK
ncbi:biopolymer transporter ExbD [Pontibacterium granulatum]|uniref:ExbD/TolR family protein n=1 Tax=Pontibacterium granulatum TaxID=2036029 RepID=UPI00249BAD7F|nr:biopolymer transporter ExbD [Pontibacterium granulatum]MDI3326093.1 biopolymer transporter ExbD [Pontibacterium granulatum]